MFTSFFLYLLKTKWTNDLRNMLSKQRNQWNYQHSYSIYHRLNKKYLGNFCWTATAYDEFLFLKFNTFHFRYIFVFRLYFWRWWMARRGKQKNKTKSNKNMFFFLFIESEFSHPTTEDTHTKKKEANCVVLWSLSHKTQSNSIWLCCFCYFKNFVLNKWR